MTQDTTCLWLTGLPAVGKSTIATYISHYGFRDRVCILDSDDVRAALWPHLGFTAEDRRMNVLALAKLAKVVRGTGANVIVSCIAPDREVRKLATAESGATLVYLQADLSELRQRAASRERCQPGVLAQLRGAEVVDLVAEYYEEPDQSEHPYISINTSMVGGPVDAATQILDACLEVYRQPGCKASEDT